MPELKNARHELFAQKVAAGMAIDVAYGEAYPEAKQGGSRRGNASRLRSQEIVAARISELQAEMASRVVHESVVTATEVLTELKRIALSDVGQLYDENGNLKHVTAIPEDARRAIAGIEVTEEFEGRGEDREHVGYTKKIKLWDKNKSLETLARHLKLLTDKVEHSGKVSLEQLVAGSMGGT